MRDVRSKCCRARVIVRNGHFDAAQCVPLALRFLDEFSWWASVSSVVFSSSSWCWGRFVPLLRFFRPLVLLCLLLPLAALAVVLALFLRPGESA